MKTNETFYEQNWRLRQMAIASKKVQDFKDKGKVFKVNKVCIKINI